MLGSPSDEHHSGHGEEKISMLLGVSQEINKLKPMWKPLQNLLTDAERRRITDRSVQAWVTMLKSAMYEASDILDLCQLEAMDRKDKSNTPAAYASGSGRSCHFLGAWGKSCRLTPALSLCVQNPDSLTSSTSYPRRENAQFVQSDLVGEEIKKNTEQLEHKLIADSRHEHGSSAVRVVAIVGQGGIGKSTLAKKVFASEAIKEEFKTKIWLSVTQQFTPMDLLRAAISQAGGKHGDEKDETMLVNALTDTLSNNKFLLVMDDVWNQQAWENVLRTPVLNAAKTQPGSRVLVTSRKVDVVRSMGASILRVDTLNDEDAWCLLKKQLPLPQPQVGVQRDFDELKDIGMKIVKKCDGLPLAIKGSRFEKDAVISMWISEGFVQHDERPGSDQLDIEEIGDEYHQELVDRNLLEPDNSNDNIWEYTLHDVVRSFAQFMAKEEAFVVQKDQVDIRNLLPENKYFCRLSIKATHSELEWTILEKQKGLRTLLLIGCEIQRGGSLANFANLRVLHISSKESDWLVDSLWELRHLRYLAFSNANISRLPGDIHKMRCYTRGFGGLTNLRTLHGFPVKTDRGWCSLEELEALSHLRILSVQGLENVAGSSVAKRAKISNKKNLEYLELSCYNYKDDEDEAEEEVRQIGMEQQEIIEAVFDELCPPPARLETLIISRYFGRRLPNWLQSPAATTFKSLKDIDLLHITYCTRLPDGLGRIHGLEELRVIDAPGIEHVGPDFQTHDAARGDGGVAFPNLRTLSLDGLSGWKEWDWEDEEQSKVIAMPALEFLFLRDCKLTHLPSGLASDRRQNLRSIVLEKLTLLEYVENFPWVVELKVYSCPELKRISGLSKLRTVDINSCPKLKLLEGVRRWTAWSWIGNTGRLVHIKPDGRVSYHKTLL
ncbi:Disease resistance protein RGA2 [Hordeum vulgare]|nr:Disease resistance protein RGA2 [Hordeum vulgare]